jgi:tRNA(Ile)-lysidine synthase
MMTRSNTGLEQQVERFWRRLEGKIARFGPEETVVVGLSGGPDSLALWDALANGIHPVTGLVAACLDHGLREVAAREVAALRRLVEGAGAMFHTARVDVPALARDEGLSVEEAARVARYRFLARVAQEEGARLVAVGHTADDQAETVLMHFLRGSGLAGLKGMLPVGPLPGAGEAFTLLRPLLSVQRVDIEAYCNARALQPFFDASNLDRTYFRNLLRHEIMPALDAVNPGLSRRLRQTANILAADEAALTSETQKLLPRLLRSGVDDHAILSLSGWRALPLSQRRRVLRAGANELEPGLRDVSFETIETARRVAERGHVGQRATLPAGITLTVGYDTLVLTRAGAAQPLRLPQLDASEAVPLALPGRLPLAHGWHLQAERELQPDLERIGANRDPWRVWIALPASTAALKVRPREPGERFQPLGLEGSHQTVKQMMINRKVPAAARDRWPIVALPEHLAWIAGQHMDLRVAVTAESEAVWRLRCIAPEENA